MTFIKRIEDDTMDFSRMKLDLINQLDMKTNQFYFVDDNNCLLIDELNVKKCLFSFGDTKIKNFQPVISIVEAGEVKR